MKKIILVIDEDTLTRYEKYYFTIHPRARKKPIPFPYHPSINEWMIMKRPMMNALKQKWKDFIAWFVAEQGYANLQIHQCEMEFDTYYKTNRPHDVDNGCPKFILDGLVAGQMIVDDNDTCIMSLLLRSHSASERPRTEICIYIPSKPKK